MVSDREPGLGGAAAQLNEYKQEEQQKDQHQQRSFAFTSGLPLSPALHVATAVDGTDALANEKQYILHALSGVPLQVE